MPARPSPAAGIAQRFGQTRASAACSTAIISGSLPFSSPVSPAETVRWPSEDGRL